MFLRPFEGLELTDAIDWYTPGSLLHDFEALLLLAKEGGLRLTASHQLSLHTVSQINERLAHPLELGLERPQQKSYPPIHGLYLLARASGLTFVDETTPRPTLFVDERGYEAWEELNPTEQYGELLETWFIRGKPEILNARGWVPWIIPLNFQDTANFYTKIPDKGMAVTGHSEVKDGFPYSPGWHNLGLLSLFGLIRVEDSTPEPGEGWHIDRIDRTPVGDALLAALNSEFFGQRDRIFVFDMEEDTPFGVLQPILQPYLPAWENSLPSAEDRQFREGVYTFKVSLGRIWHRVAIGAQFPLDSLASMILHAVNFDSDHLYKFSYQNRYGVTQEIMHPYMDEGPFTSEVRIGELPLRVGQHMEFIFDFGDWWEFEVTLEQINPDKRTQKPRILETHGNPPEQYPQW
jgi:hypothetical protein